MRLRLWLSVVLGWSIPILAADLTVRVVDRSHVAVPGAQVEIYSGEANIPLRIETTSPQGFAEFREVSGRVARIHVLAPGFAEK